MRAWIGGTVTEPVVLQSGLLEVSQSVNTLLILFSSFLVFFMQPGFALLEVGQVRAKNTANVAMKNLFDWSQGVLAYFLVGSAIATLVGALTSSGTLSLDDAFAHFSDPSVLATWLFGAVFAMTAATIVSGAVVGRIKFSTYVVFGTAMVAVIYPVVEGLAWYGLLTADGYVGELLGTRYIDFAGATVVHMTGGIAGLVAAAIIGPRRLRYEGKEENAIPGHSVFFSLLGAFVLAFGWYGFNVGSHAVVLSAGGSFEGGILGQIAVNTTLAMGAGTLVSALVTTVLGEKPDPLFSANGMIAGLVAITAGAAQVTWWGSILIGGSAGALVMPIHYWVVSELQIDDAISVFPVHACSGALGTILLPLVAVGPNGGWQVLGLNQVLMQATGIVVIAGWTVVSTVTAFGVIEKVLGLDLRVSETEEEQGLDASEHGISAYPEFALAVGPTVGATEADGGQERDAATSDSRETTTESAASNSTTWRGQEVETSSVPASDTGNQTTVWRGQEVDVSNKTEYKYELEAVTNRLKMALDETETGVWELNVETNEFVVDDASERLLGYDAGEFPGSVAGFLDRVHPEDVETVEAEIDRALEEKTAEFDADFRVQSPDGTQRWLGSRGVVKYEDGQPVRILGIQTDLTERKERERDLETLKQVFARVFRHNVRNELTVAKGNVEMITEQSSDEGVLEMAENTADSMERLLSHTEKARQIKRLLDERPERVRASLRDIVTTAIEREVTVPAAVSIECEVPDVPVFVIEGFETAVATAIENAIEHNPGPVTIGVSAKLNSDTVELCIEDDGEGISSAEAKVLDETEEKPLQHGSGVGLWVMKWYVETSDGTLSVTGDESGTTVEMTLRRA